ncbi:MAG: alpha/beta hydrolase, partial [Hyphomicrobiaceae bacterium]
MLFLLIHGAWHGGWAWQAVAERLRMRGHEVQAPDLPGLGADAENLSPTIGLEDHIEAVLPDVPHLLCAHSYGGMIARAIVDRRPDLIEGFVLIEALWPSNGQRALDVLAPAARSETERAIQNEGAGWRIPVPNVDRFAIPDSEIAAAVGQRLTPHPAKTFTDRIDLHAPSSLGTYLIANDREPQPYAETAARLGAEGWTVQSASGGHELM